MEKEVLKKPTNTLGKPVEEFKIKRFLINRDTREAIELVGEKTFGRKKTCDVQIQDELVSGVHMKIINEVSRTLIVDLGSYNKTKINGVVLEPNVENEVKEGDEIRIGAQVYVLSESNRLPQDQLFDDENIHVETLLDYSEPPEWGEDPEVDFRFKQLQQKRDEVQNIIDRIHKAEDEIEKINSAKAQLKSLDNELAILTEVFPSDSLPGWRAKSKEYTQICQELEELAARKEELETKVRQFLRYEEISKAQLECKELVNSSESVQEIDHKIGELRFQLSGEQEFLKTLQNNYDRELRKTDKERKERKKAELKKTELARKIEELQNELKKIK